ncbi:MAG TPA: hypothetical protein VGF52_03515 [Tepidisphaeraceae bacterium]|jgi:hypothetical protein
MTSDELQSLCEQAQEQLMQMQYLAAEKLLAAAEAVALEQNDFDTLARLYMPLQEARRQRRQRCGEGIVRLDLISAGPADVIDPWHVVQNYPHGQLLVAGWGSIEPALGVRRLQAEHDLYVETFLAAAYPVGDGRAIVIFPLEAIQPPPPQPRSIDELLKLLPPHCIVMQERELPKSALRGNSRTFANVMSMWERLHAPFLAAADATPTPLKKIEAYRKTIRVDYACELAHQKLSDLAKQIARATAHPA